MAESSIWDKKSTKWAWNMLSSRKQKSYKNQNKANSRYSQHEEALTLRIWSKLCIGKDNSCNGWDTQEVLIAQAQNKQANKKPLTVHCWKILESPTIILETGKKKKEVNQTCIPSWYELYLR